MGSDERLAILEARSEGVHRSYPMDGGRPVMPIKLAVATCCSRLSCPISSEEMLTKY